jgi:hypothetical protein
VDAPDHATGSESSVTLRRFVNVQTRLIWVPVSIKYAVRKRSAGRDAVLARIVGRNGICGDSEVESCLEPPSVSGPSGVCLSAGTWWGCA